MTAAFGDNCEDVRQIWSKESFSDTYSSAHFVPNKGAGPNMYHPIVQLCNDSENIIFGNKIQSNFFLKKISFLA